MNLLRRDSLGQQAYRMLVLVIHGTDVHDNQHLHLQLFSKLYEYYVMRLFMAHRNLFRYLLNHYFQM